MKSRSNAEPIVLVITDTPAHKVFLKRALVPSHYFMEASTPLEAAEKIKNNDIALIIASEKLENTSLQELCSAIRSSPHGKFIPILVISNNLKKAFAQEMIASGVSDFLREPLNEMDLEQKMVKSLHSKRTQEKLSPIVKIISAQGQVQSQKPLHTMKISQRDLALSEIDKALKQRFSLSLLLLDIDHHLKIKEKWGELALEELIDAVEIYVKEQLRAQDVLTHASEERFVIILPKTSETAAKIIAEDLKESFIDHKFSLTKGLIKVTVSIGLTSLSTKDDTENESAYTYLEKMLSRGEDYLSKAKKLGNRIVSGESS